MLNGIEVDEELQKTQGLTRDQKNKRYKRIKNDQEKLAFLSGIQMERKRGVSILKEIHHRYNHKLILYSTFI